MKENFFGVYAVAVTPFCEDGSFNFEAAKRNADRLIECGVHGICMMGATSEYLSVTDEEYAQYIKEMVPYVKGRTHIVVGATRERTEDVVKLMGIAKDCGAEAAMVLPPYYCHPSQNEIYEHYEFITSHVKLPVIIYNNPGSSGVEIESKTIAKLFGLPNIAILKESTGDVRKTTALVMDAPQNISVFCGCDNLAYEALSVGADGWICMLANVAPKSCVRLYELIKANKSAEALALYKKMLPSLNMLENYGKPTQIIKYILDCQGYEGGYVRRPRRELTTEDKEIIQEIIRLNNLG